MREGWEMKKLGEVCGFVRGPFGGSLKKDCFVENGFAVYEQQHAIYDKFDEIRYFVDEKKFNEMKRFELLSGDLIMSCSGTMGKVAIVPSGIQKGIINQALLKLTPKKNIDIQYLRYWMVSDVFIKSIEKHSKGAAIKNVASVAILKNIEFPVPPLPEQQRIVAYLNQTFAKLNQAKANILQNIKNAKELFETELRNVFENKGDGWEEKSLGECCEELFAGGDAPKENFSIEKNELNNIPIYANAVKDDGLYGYTNFARVTKPSITIAARGSGTGHTLLRNENYFPIVRVIVVIPKSEIISVDFLKLAIDTLVIVRSGSAIPQLTIPMIRDYKIPFPKSLQTQQEIVAKLDALKTQTQALEASYQAKLNNLEELYSGILKRAFENQLIEA